MRLRHLSGEARDGGPDDELIARSAPERVWLCKGKVMWVRWHTAADEAGLPQYESAVVLVAQANHFPQGADHVSARLLLGPQGKLLVCGCAAFPAPSHGHTRRVGRARVTTRRANALISSGRSITRSVGTIVDLRKPRRKCLLDKFGICSCQGVLGRQIPMRPGGAIVGRIYSRHLLNQGFAKACCCRPGTRGCSWRCSLPV